MSDSEEELAFFGKPLEPYDEDAFPKKKPISVEEQVARDAQGRRRFHGAFTGGFSAGFFNTVGSLEGWRPQEFKSSRSEKASNKQQKPEDFMDDEDVGEFGIAPQTVKATKEYSSNKKRKRQAFSDGPIPGVPVLETLLQAGNETIGYFLMKNMNSKQRKVVAENSGPKVYDCVMPVNLPADEETELPEYNLPPVYAQYLSQPKSNTFGLGYVGLDKTHVNLFQSTKLTVRDRNNKKLSISGQAFGVGAFENDDEDIYVKDDMSRYDFELTSESSSKNKKDSTKNQGLVLEMFVLSKNSLTSSTNFPLPVIPSSFSGKHNVRKSRFEPLSEEQQTPKRSSINAAIRAKYLGEDHSDKTYTPSNQQHKQKQQPEQTEKAPVVKKYEEPSSSGLFDRFVSAKQEDDPTNILEPVQRSETTHGTEEMRAAVKMKMFGPLTRVTVTWQPCSLLCKRFNVPEPHSGGAELQKNKKRTKNLIFQYQQHNEEVQEPQPGLQKMNVPPEDNNKVDTPQSDAVEQIIIKEEQLEETQQLPPPSATAQEVEEQQQKSSDMTDRVDVSKNIDLFKAVFLSSSESESEMEDAKAEEEEEQRKRKELMTASVLSEPLVPKIKSTREGILSNIDFTKMNMPKVKDEPSEVVETCKVDSYGPKLPDKIAHVELTSVVNDSGANNDEWVEKDGFVKQKKHKKKHKKDKGSCERKKKHKHKSRK